MKPLHLGAAYHGNRMPHHAREDFLDMATHGMDTVVHMLSHTDWDRHKEVMKELIYESQAAGLTPWVDNWGIGGPPGDKSHFLAYHPEAHVILSDGTPDPVRACVNQPSFREFTRAWIDTVDYIGSKTIFWDEPHMPTVDRNGKKVYGCTCPVCRKLFAEKFGREMPETPDADTMLFGASSIADYMNEMTTYSHSKGMVNTCCVMIGTYGMSLDQADLIAALPHMDNVGSDPYWINHCSGTENVYNFVRRESEKNIALCEKFGKDHNLWVQTYNNPRGMEEDIVTAAAAIYDSGARTILSWGYYGSESNDYRAKNAPVAWSRLCEAFLRLREFDRDRALAECRANYKK